MARIIIVLIMCAALFVSGCSEKDEEIAEMQDGTTESAVQDSIKRAEEAALADSIAAASVAEPEPEPDTYGVNTDYSQLDGYVAQIGSYAERNFAEMIAEKYQNRDYPAFVTSLDIDGATYYRVRVGVYETFAEAKEIGNLIKDRYSIEFWVDSNR